MMYLYVKAFHLIAVVTWFAALFYLPRLFVYHAMSEDQISRDRFVTMERKLLRGIMTPSMIAVWVLGLTLVWLNPSAAAGGWFGVKFILVLLLSGYHGMCVKHQKAFARGETLKSHVYYRWFNEVPVVVLIAVVILAVVKPF